ncbi:TetR/AcrR family transcriptional regulator [Nocardia sp. NPDC101769]|uniref:TetR/AcrR family transcriptional regulator n=1 Tax=Nocardia sp. NPDC101769 TaxID=3364333 RepID=UPI0037FF241C
MSPRKAAVLRGADDDRNLRDHLVTTAQRLLAGQGAAGLTVRAIARAAGVADGVLYNHFPDKDALLAAAVGAHVAAAHADLGPLPTPGTATVQENLALYLRAGLTLHRAVLPVFTGLLSSPAVLARYVESKAHNDDWRELLARYLRAERDLSRLASDADTTAATALLVGICHDTVLTAMLPGTRPAEVDVDVVVATLLAGIAPHP